MNLFVTGAAGFVGSYAIPRLMAAGHCVTALRPRKGLPADSSAGRVRWVQADLFNADQLASVLHRHDAVVHLAGWFPLLGQPGPAAELAHANVAGMSALLQACSWAEVTQIVHASSAQVYGPSTKLALREEDPLLGTSPYARSKIEAERLLTDWASQLGRSGANLRLFNVYGPGQSQGNVVSSIMRQALAANEVCLHSVWPQRDFVYADDVASAVVAAVQCRELRGTAINIGSGAAVEIGWLARRVLQLAGHLEGKVRASRQESPSDNNPARITADTSLAQELLCWSPAVPFDVGLSHTLDWMRGLSEKA